jgi:hypothetical protein
MKALVIVAMAFLVTGCAQVAPRVAKAVNRYCEEPLSTRLLLRSSVNQMTQPNSVKVHCDGDPVE